MKNVVLLLVVVFLFVSGLNAQDGIYGSFIVGMKTMDMSGLNEALKNSYNVKFENSNLTFGGEGHVILARHFLLGGMGTLLTKEKPDESDDQTRIRVTSGMGLANLGYAFLAGKDKQLRFYPRLGLGVSSTVLQRKATIDSSDKNFDDILSDDEMSVIQRISFAADISLGFDWYISIIEFVKIIPGFSFGPLVHIEAGYSVLPADLGWSRDVDGAGFSDPKTRYQGLHVNVGIGIGLASTK